MPTRVADVPPQPAIASSDGSPYIVEIHDDTATVDICLPLSFATAQSAIVQNSAAATQNSVAAAQNSADVQPFDVVRRPSRVVQPPSYLKDYHRNIINDTPLPLSPVKYHLQHFFSV